jgi:hypothetical protein
MTPLDLSAGAFAVIAGAAWLAHLILGRRERARDPLHRRDIDKRRAVRDEQHARARLAPPRDLIVLPAKAPRDARDVRGADHDRKDRPK